MVKDFNVRIGNSVLKKSYLDSNTSLDSFSVEGSKRRRCKCGIFLEYDEDSMCKYCLMLKE